MQNVKLACHTITFGENQKDDLDAVFAAIAAAGYSGLEIGIRHIQEIAPAELRSLLDQHGLHMVATHIGGNLIDRDQADRESEILDEILEILKHTGSKYLMYSGLKDANADLVAAEIDRINRAAVQCLQYGVQLLYHNHNWEFFGDQSPNTWEALIANAAPEVKLCPDLGWLHKAGVDLVGFLQTYQDRIGVIHYKDFASLDQDLRNTVVLGDGIVPLEPAAKWISENMPDVWVISEQDFADIPPAEAILANAAFFKGE